MDLTVICDTDKYNYIGGRGGGEFVLTFLKILQLDSIVLEILLCIAYIEKQK